MKTPLQRQFRLWTILLVFVPSLMIMTIYTVNQIQIAKRQNLELVNQRVYSQKLLIDYWMTGRADDIRALSRSDSIRTFDEQQIKQVLTIAQQANNKFDSLAYINKDGIIKISTHGENSQQPSVIDRPYFQAAMAGKEYISDIITGRISGSLVFAFSSPLYDYAGNVQGVIVGYVKTATLETLLRDNWIGQTGEVFLVNREGTMITEPRYVNVLIDRGLVETTAKMNFKITADAFRNTRLGGTGTATWIDYLGNRVLGAYQGMPEQGWTIIGKINEEEVLAPIYQQLRLMAGGTIIAVLLILPLATLLTNRIKRPIDWLIRQSNLIATKNYEMVGQNAFLEKMPRELANLCQTFTDMSREIANTVGLLKENEAKLESKVIEIQDVNATLEEEIAERQAAQAELHETHDALIVSEARYRGLFDHIQNSFTLQKVITDENGRPVELEYVDVNPAFEGMICRKAADIVGRRFKEVYTGINEKPFNWIQELGEVALTGQPKNFEAYFAVSGRWYHFSAYSPEKGFIALISADITERKQAEQQLKYLNAELAGKMQELQNVNATLEEEIMERQAAQEALLNSRDSLIASEGQLKRHASELSEINKELKSFVNIVAHDFRAPMVNLKGFSRELGHSLNDLRRIVQDTLVHLPQKAQAEADELMEKDIPDELQFIHSAVDRLDRMVNVLLQLAREGRREMVYKQVDCNEIVKAVLQTFDHQITQKGIQVEVGPMPIIVTDYLAMEQIIGNLMDNAIKYLEPDRPGKISISCTDNGDEYLFSVRDNGRGIANQDQEKVFEIFRRAGNQNIPGEGIGLAYVRTLIRQLGGKVWCESEIGMGTRFNFSVSKIIK